jgi:hypothetical protein
MIEIWPPNQSEIIIGRQFSMEKITRIGKIVCESISHLVIRRYGMLSLMDHMFQNISIKMVMKYIDQKNCGLRLMKRNGVAIGKREIFSSPLEVLMNIIVSPISTRLTRCGIHWKLLMKVLPM